MDWSQACPASGDILAAVQQAQGDPLDAGAEDVAIEEDGLIEVHTAPEDYVKVKQAMIDAGLEPVEAELTMRASNNTELNLEDGEKVMRLIDALEELDDVQEVFSNADFPDELFQ